MAYGSGQSARGEPDCSEPSRFRTASSQKGVIGATSFATVLKNLVQRREAAPSGT